MELDKKTLKQHKSLRQELESIDKKLDKLYERQEKVPEVMGKVTGSSHDFPYTQVRTTVRMAEPKESDTIKKLILIKEKRRKQINNLIIEIEEFIAGIPDSETRRIFELTYLEGKKQTEVAKELGYSKGRISQKINEYLKD